MYSYKQISTTRCQTYNCRRPSSDENVSETTDRTQRTPSLEIPDNLPINKEIPSTSTSLISGTLYLSPQKQKSNTTLVPHRRDCIRYLTDQYYEYIDHAINENLSKTLFSYIKNDMNELYAGGKNGRRKTGWYIIPNQDYENYMHPIDQVLLSTTTWHRPIHTKTTM